MSKHSTPEPRELYDAVLELLKSPHTVTDGQYLVYSTIHLVGTGAIATLQTYGVTAGLLTCHEFGPADVLWYNLTDAGEQWMRGEAVLTQLEQTAPQGDTLWAAVFTATVFVSSGTPLEPTDAEVDAALAFTKRMRDVWGRCGT